MAILIREATDADFEAIWPIFHAVVKTGDTYAYPPTTSKEEARSIWLQKPLKTYVAEEEGILLGTYYIKENQSGPGNHVCNCGYMVSEKARGKGIATQMCEHSQKIALELGFKAMQYNSVVASNVGAVRLWQSLGYDIIGTLPKAYNHQTLGYVDAHVMYKWLAA